MSDPQRGLGTRAVHGPPAPVVGQQPLVAPIYRTATFVFDTAQQMADVFAGRERTSTGTW